MPSPRCSLKARALQLLAQREQSGVELRRKLTRHAADIAKAAAESQRSAERREAAAGSACAWEESADTDDTALVQRVEDVLDWLRSNGLASDERFAESRVNARWARFGNLRIRDELSRHGVAPDGEWTQRLDDSEMARAQQVWAVKFGTAPGDAAAQARQYRFLAGRGFSPDVIRCVVRQAMREAAVPAAQQSAVTRPD